MCMSVTINSNKSNLVSYTCSFYGGHSGVISAAGNLYAGCGLHYCLPFLQLACGLNM